MRQLSAIFLIVLIVGSSASTLKNKLQNKQSIISEIQDKNSQFYSLLEEGSQYVVDEVLGLLQNLEDAAEQDLTDLNGAWAVEQASLTNLQNLSKQAWLQQQQECDNLEGQQHDLEHSIQVRVDETNANNQQISDDHDIIELLKKERCASNNAYIDHIVDHRDALLLFQVLRAAIEGYEPGSFVQLTKFKKNAATLGDYINLYANKHTAAFNQIMSQLRQVNDNGRYENNLNNDAVADYVSNDQYSTADRVQERSDVGSGHVDNDREQITVDDLDQSTVRDLAAVRGQLLKVLDEITDVENSRQNTLEIQESQANEATAAYKKNLQDEQRRLTRRNEVLALEVSNLQVRLAAKVIEVDQCRDQEALLLSSYNQAQQALIDATGRYEARKETLQEEVALFDKLYLYYKERVYAVATQADKERIEDYSENQSFDNTSDYTAKSASDFNGLSGNVAETLSAQAEDDVE